MKNLHNRLRKLADHARGAGPVTIRLEVVEDDGHGNLTKNGLPYTPEPGRIILRPGHLGVNDEPTATA